MPIPKRWLQYSKYGNQIPGTRFIALKCPLKKAICSNLPEEYWFTPEMVLSEMPSVGMLIDLTNTHRYYSPQALSGVQHVKLMCPGQQVPGSHMVLSFFNAVDSFLRSSIDGLIGVHCTHGVNRTGFFICKYLIGRMGFSPEQAARAFNGSRGHQMERGALVRALEVPLEVLDSVLGPEPVDLCLEVKLQREMNEAREARVREPGPSFHNDRQPQQWHRDMEEYNPHEIRYGGHQPQQWHGAIYQHVPHESSRREDDRIDRTRHRDQDERRRYGRDSYREIGDRTRDLLYRADGRPPWSRGYHQDSRDYRRVYGNLDWRRERRPRTEIDHRDGKSSRGESSSAGVSNDDDYRMYRVLQ
ncbi:mRNA-capping enzyme isoform X1 [Cloeon dipterum]|uniref:mRNA-capping enzyme isoform X1 n=2 Tax=Cloeon dipterum TaxID=197152 RepID=UPI00321FBA84